jgi:hypothetical protein
LGKTGKLSTEDELAIIVKMEVANTLPEGQMPRLRQNSLYRAWLVAVEPGAFRWTNKLF